MNAPQPHPPAVRTTCPYCGVGCGILARPDGMGGAEIAGDPQHPANFGRLCSKGAALGETLGLDNRLLHPMRRRDDGTLMRITWDKALDGVADGLKRVIERHGPDAIAFYLSGQLLTEDYYVANKLMKGFIGSANVDTNSRLCMASSVAGHRRAFGTDTVPGNYADLDEAELIVLVGSNAAWCHPVLFQRMLANRRERGARLVVIDPRRTATGDESDLFLSIAPGMDTVLFSGLLVHLSNALALDYRYIEEFTHGFEDALVRAQEIAPDLDTVARKTRLARADIAMFFEWFAKTPRVVTCFSQGVNQSAQGTDKVNAIINCHLATGRIGHPGMGPFSLTGQPNAMGGREVGGLANQLAAHMDFAPENVARVGRFWNARAMARGEGLKAVDMFEAIAGGEIKALWVMATNPAVSLPQASAVRQALQELELFVVSENVISNDTVASGAHVLLPASAWGEKDGTVTNSERRISRLRPFMQTAGEARPDWWIVTQVARRMGFGQAFPYESVADVFREHAALSCFENGGRRDFDIGALAELSDSAFDALDPVQWPLREGQSLGESRLFSEGGFFTPDRRARFIAPDEPALRARLSSAFPFRLNTGRIRDQWHTMTRTGLSPRLGGHLAEPFVEVNPADAQELGLRSNGFARVTTPYGACVLRVRIAAGQQRRSLFAPIHWSGTTASSARVGDLVAPETDPYSGQPEAKATPASIEPHTFRFCGFVLAREAPSFADEDWFARVAVKNGAGALLATDTEPAAWARRAGLLFRAGVDFAEYVDQPSQHYRAAAFAKGRLIGCLFIGPADDPPQWDAVKALFEAEALAPADRRGLLSGQSSDGVVDTGPLVCACFGVSLEAIRRALATGEATTVEQIGAKLKAGTNCGSCIPELKRIVLHERVAQAV